MRWILALALGLMYAANGAAEHAAAPTVRLHFGDDPRWSASEWDDSAWHRLTPGAVPLGAGPFWIRFRITVPGQAMASSSGANERITWRRELLEHEADSLAFSLAFPFELYWDGRKLAWSGVVGASRDTEVLGPVEHLVRIPDDLRRPGEHVVAMRLSTRHFSERPLRAELPLTLQPYAGRLADATLQPVLPLVGLSCALFLAAICIVMLEFSERRRPLWLSIGLCGALAMYCALVALSSLYNAPYDILLLTRQLSIGLIAVISILVPWLLLEQFSVPHARWWLLVIGVAVGVQSVAVPEQELRELWLSRTMLAASLLIALRGAWVQCPCAWVVAASALLRLLVVYPSRSVFAEPGAFIMAGILILFICRTLAARGRAERQHARAARLTAARLEVELLKKNIQPHFLMNTLATIIDVVEQDPRTAVTLIEALAGEFRILARVSGEKLIPLRDEIELCRSHLRIMSVRRNLRCSLTTSGVDPFAPVPPGLFHTLVEGGLSHQRPRRGELGFALDASYAAGCARYSLTARGETPPTCGVTVDGTGMRYVKARLEESFAGRWSLVAGPVAEGWRTLILISPPRRQERIPWQPSPAVLP